MLTFSPINKVILSPLARYLSKILKDGSLFVIIATPQRTRALRRAIEREGVDVAQLVAGGQLVIIDAEHVAEQEGVNIVADQATTQQIMETMAKLFVGSGKAVYTLREKAASPRLRHHDRTTGH